MNGTWTAAMPGDTVGKRAYINARLLDPATGMDEIGALLTDGETIADVGPHLFTGGSPEDIPTIDCNGHSLAPGLVDSNDVLVAFCGLPGPYLVRPVRETLDAQLVGPCYIHGMMNEEYEFGDDYRWISLV